MSKYVKLEDAIEIFKYDSKDSHILYNEAKVTQMLESLPVLIVPKTINGVVLKDCDKVIEPFLEEHEYGDLWEAVRALRDFYDWITEEERKDNE